MLVYQCQHCDFANNACDSIAEHMIYEHQIEDTLVENVHFRHLAIGELMKRCVNEIDALTEDAMGGMEDAPVPSPDSAIILNKEVGIIH